VSDDGNVSFDELELRAWPRRDLSLRARSSDNRAYAFLAWQQGRGLPGRIMGYRRAAEILATAMLADSRNIRDLDTVIFPFAACWRHYVELQLKWLITQCQELLDLPVKRRGGHNIEQLWSELRALLVQAYPAEEKRDLSVVGRLLKQFAQIDPDSQDFRYVERRDGTPTLVDIDHIDICDFHEAMLAVANYFEAIDSAIDHDKDMKNEALQYEWEIRQEYEQEMRDWYQSNY
jgi:hypothetical protein